MNSGIVSITTTTSGTSLWSFLTYNNFITIDQPNTNELWIAEFTFKFGTINNDDIYFGWTNLDKPAAVSSVITPGNISGGVFFHLRDSILYMTHRHISTGSLRASYMALDSSRPLKMVIAMDRKNQKSFFEIYDADTNTFITPANTNILSSTFPTFAGVGKQYFGVCGSSGGTGNRLSGFLQNVSWKTTNLV